MKVCSSVHMTGGHGDIEPDTAASGLLQRIDELELGVDRPLPPCGLHLSTLVSCRS